MRPLDVEAPGDLVEGRARGRAEATSKLDCASAPADGQADAKVRATWQAKFAMAGYELVPLSDGSFVVARWGMVRALRDLAAVAAFGNQVGVR